MDYRFAVCDDDGEYAQYVGELAAQWAALTGVTVELERFPSAEAFLFRYEERRDFDVLLLDIEMGELDGVALAKAVRRDNDDVQIVFITGYADYIAEGYEVSALHYLTKPVEPHRLFQVLDRAVSRLARNEAALTLELPGETVRVPLSRIRYLEVSHNHVTVHGPRDYRVKRPLGELEKALGSRFFRVGRSFVVNLAFIRRVTRAEAELSTGERVPLPRGQYEKLNRAIIDRI
ncbi:MAG: LytTR family DNA-binding domain-containing protein [Oscillospiraceae bacterium]|nr:LytTR family DNA-binding domain-containing protein [Oscillospiraceae bacterium]